MGEPGMVDVVMDFLPAIVTIMMLVMLVGMIGKIRV